MNRLKDLHEHLYRRVRLKGVTFTALGLGLIIPNHLPLENYLNRNTADSTRLYAYMSYDIWGAIFLIIGLGVLGSLWYGRRITAPLPWLRAAFIYAMFWLFALAFAVATGNARSVAVVVLWAYLTYNLWYIGNDSGWEGARLVKEIRERHDAG